MGRRGVITRGKDIVSGSITYQFRFKDGREARFALPLHSRPGEPLLKPKDQADYPAWTVLGICKCPHCPYDETERTHCPVAANLSVVMDDFKDFTSYDRVYVEVHTSERTYVKEVALQDSLYSFMGLIMALSDCPHLKFLRPMARFHLPFSSVEETLVRVTSFYLLGQYFVFRRDGHADFEFRKLDGLYANVRILNNHLLKRIRTISRSDAHANSIVILEGFCQIMSYEITDGLSQVERTFSL